MKSIKKNIKAISKTYLKKEVIDSSELPENKKVAVPVGKTYQILNHWQAENGHYQVELDHGAGTWYLWPSHWELPGESRTENIFTCENLQAIMPEASSADIAAYVASLNKVLGDFNLAKIERACAFIAQIAHESGSLKYKEEIASGAAYEGRRDLGNTQPGDGKRFKGRGLIQLTGRANYRQCGQALGLPLEENPELVVEDPDINAAVAAWYWESRKINDAADQGNFEKVTRLINGGLNGYQDRYQFWERAKRVMSSGAVSSVVPTWKEINWSDFNAKVSKYFTVGEVTNCQTRRIPTDDNIKQNIIALAQELDKVREAWGSGIIVTSWYRPPAVNKAIGGASKSQHISGKAADVKPCQGDIYKFQDWLDKGIWKDKALGYGAKKGFVHLDLRPGHIRWNY